MWCVAKCGDNENVFSDLAMIKYFNWQKLFKSIQ